MKTTNFILIALVSITLAFQSCSDDLTTIKGHGAIVTEELSIDEFNSIAIQGVDDVHIQYGEVQKVEVKGHANIIDLIRKEVKNGTWYIELEDGRYGHYDLTYYLTLPEVKSIRANGTGDVIIDYEMTQEEIDIDLSGTGNYYGFLMTVNRCEVNIVGTGVAEVTVIDELDVNIEGTGNVHYKGHPDLQSTISGSGKIINANN